MSNAFKRLPTKGSSAKASKYSHNIPGKLTSIIGSGKPAQEAIVWRTIEWCFLVAGIVTVLFFIRSCANPTAAFEAENLKEIWSIFIPVITLALGYIFGKADK